MKIKISFLILVFSAGLLCAGPPDDKSSSVKEGESDLAALAKKEADRRQNLPDKGLVITNQNLASLLGNMKSRRQESVITEVSADVSTDSADSPAGSDAEPGSREEMLEEIREDLMAARQQVVTLSNSYMVLELRINNLRNKLYQEADPLRLQRLQEELSNNTSELQRIRTEEMEARRELDRLKNEAKRAGMKPGQIDDLVGEIPVTQTTATVE